MNLLITGAGSLIGHGILRSLREMENRDFKLFTADPDHRAAGHWLGDYGIKIPMANDEAYLTVLKTIIKKFKIDLVFVGTDPELIKISAAKKELGATAVISDPEVIHIGEDKWLTVNFLKQNGFPYPDSALSRDRDEVNRLVAVHGFPLFAKPRIGARSVGVQKINDNYSLQEVLKQSNYIVQEYLPSEPGEFTAGTMTYEQQSYSQVIFRRDLKDGNTYRAYHYRNEAHERFIARVSETMKGVYGPLNLQYRIKNNMPVIFEINSRYSGTTPLRTAIGVNEVSMALQFYRTGKITPPKLTLTNVAFFRAWCDIIVPADQVEDFRQAGELSKPSGSYFPFFKP